MLVRRWRRVAVVSLVVLVAAGLWLTHGAGILAPVPDLPILVNVTERLHDGSVGRQFETRDRTFLTRLNEFFPGYRKSKAAGERPSGAHFQLDFIIQGEPHARTIYVWEDGDKEWWSADRDRHPVLGSFRLLVDCLAIQRAFELVHGPQEGDRDTGRKLLIENGDHFFDIAFESCRRQSKYARYQAIRHLQSLVYWQTPKAPCTAGCYPNFGLSRERIAGPFPAEHPRIAEVRLFALGLLEEPHMARDAIDLLSLVADEVVIEELIGRLKSSKEWSHSADLIIALQTCLGLPDEFSRGGMCGNSSAAERRQFAVSEEKRTKEATSKLLDRMGRWKGLPDDQRLDMVLQAWRPVFDQKYADGSYHWEEQIRRCQNLLRRGRAMIPAINAAQATTTSLQHRAGLEFAKAFWTGECDRSLIEELLRSGPTPRMLACDIIAATQDPSWKEELVDLIGQQIAGDPETAHLEIKASETLVICLGVEALPLLKSTGTVGRGNNIARAALMHFSVPAGGY